MEETQRQEMIHVNLKFRGKPLVTQESIAKWQDLRDQERRQQIDASRAAKRRKTTNEDLYTLRRTKVPLHLVLGFSIGKVVEDLETAHQIALFLAISGFLIFSTFNK